MNAIRYVRTAEAKTMVSGREGEVLTALGIAYNMGNPHIDCPYPTHGGKNDWRWDAENSIAYCTCLGRHSIFDVVINFESMDFEAAKVRIAEILGRHDLIRTSTQRGGMSAENLLNRPPEECNDGLPRNYLAHRLGIEPDAVLMPTTDVVGMNALPYYDPPHATGDKPTLVGKFPCTVWKMIGPDGAFHAHRIYVAPNGLGKADLGKTSNGRPRNPKKSAKVLNGQSITGCCVVFGNPNKAEHLIGTEGLETAAAVANSYESEVLSNTVAVVAAISAVGVEAVKPWPATQRITVAADRDEYAKGTRPPSRRGEKAAATLAARLANVVPVSVALPGEPGESKDWLDVFRQEGIEAVRLGIEAAPVEDVAAIDRGAEIVPLARLTLPEYERERDAVAERLGIRPMTLDALVKIERSRKTVASADGLFSIAEPWPSPVDLAELLDDIKRTVRRFIVCDEKVSVAVTLWVAFTWFTGWAHVAPLLVITAPEKRCGKTQLLSLAKWLSYRALAVSNITSAALYRVIEAWEPTLLIDEADTFLKRNEELRGILNSGHTRDSAYVIRLEGDDHEPRLFSTWGAKAIAGIGRLAETIEDRAIVVELRRKRPDETADTLRHAEREHFDQLSRMLARVKEDLGEAIGSMRPELPSEMNDRARDNWEPLLGIADYAGGHWPETARATALKLSGVSSEALSLSAELLADIRAIFEQRGCDKIPTADLLTAVNADEEKPWATYSRGRPLTARNLAKLLGEYGIRPRNIWMGSGASPKGYSRDQFQDAFARYLPVETPNSAEVPTLSGENQESLQALDATASGPVLAPPQSPASAPPMPPMRQTPFPLPPRAQQPVPAPCPQPPFPPRAPQSAPTPYPQPPLPPRAAQAAPGSRPQPPLPPRAQAPSSVPCPLPLRRPR